MSDNQTPFATPDAGNLQTGKLEYFPTVEYSTMKTPANFVSDVTPQKVADARATFKLGFHFYDKDTSARVAIDKFSFVVLECYSGLSGWRETSPGQGVSYFSNYVKNVKNEQFTLFEKGVKRPIAMGFYEGKKHDGDYTKLISSTGVAQKIPDGAGFHQHFMVYWLEGDRILDLRLTTMISREIKLAISVAEGIAGRKVKPERVNLFALADGGVFWGFSVSAFKKVAKDGADHAGVGDMYLVPKLVSGVVKTEGDGANPELHEKCAAMQQEIRAGYSAEIERRSKFDGNANANAQQQQVQDQPNLGEERFPENAPAQHRNQSTPPPAQTTGFAAGKPAPNATDVNVPDINYDDLPF